MKNKQANYNFVAGMFKKNGTSGASSEPSAREDIKLGLHMYAGLMQPFIGRVFKFGNYLLHNFEQVMMPTSAVQKTPKSIDFYSLLLW